MSGCEAIEARLNLRDGAVIRECGSFDEAVLWCYRHDCGALGVGPASRHDPDFEARLGFALPHLEDYLRLILKAPESFDIPAYARSLHERMIDESERIERDSDGELAQASWEAYYKRFSAPDFEPADREMEVSVYPFPPFEIDLEDLSAKPPTFKDPRCERLADLFKKYFPMFSGIAASVCYPSYTDRLYIFHGSSVVLAMKRFFYSNPIVPRTTDYNLDRGLREWEAWATIMLRPRVIGENF
ncbi:MAG TPA: hypothetical protein VF718_11050 [Allosphingosinicella sp.]